MFNKDANENYRSERKQRIAKTAKSGSKKSSVDSVKIVKAIISVVCVVALLGVAYGVLFAYGVPQQVLPFAKTADNSYSIEEYTYFYSTIYESYYSTTYQYTQQMGYNLTGFDTTKSPADQTYTDDDGNEMTYAEYFDTLVIDKIKQTEAYYSAAVAAGKAELSDEDKATIDETIATLATNADTYGYSLNRYITIMYGKGMSEKKLRSMMEKELVAGHYSETYSSDIASQVSDEEIEAKYNEDVTAYNVCDLRVFGFAVEDSASYLNKDESETTTSAAEATTSAEGTTAAEETTAEETTAEETTAEETSAEATTVSEETTAEGATAAEATTAEATTAAPTDLELLAEEMRSRITDESSFVTLAQEYCAAADAETFKEDSATLAIGISLAAAKNLNADFSTWLFDAQRANGDTYTFTATDNSNVYVIYVIKTQYREDTPTVNARHILLSYGGFVVADENEETTTAGEKTTAANEETTIATEATTAADESTTAADEATTAAVVDTTAAAEETSATEETTAAPVADVVLTDEDYAIIAFTDEDDDGIDDLAGCNEDTLIATYKAALGVLNTYNAGEKTETAFAELAEKNSFDTASIISDDGDDEEAKSADVTAEGGGLYEDIKKGEMVSQFESYVYDTSRVAGDVAIVKTAAGFHIIYFVNANDEATWKASVRSTLAETLVTDGETALTDAIEVKVYDMFRKFGYNQAIKLLDKLYF